MFVFYVFLVSCFGLAIFYLPAMLGIGGLAAVLEGSSYSWQLNQTVGSLSLAAVAGVIWRVHWRMLLSRRAADGHNLAYFQMFLASSLLVIGLLVHGTNTLSSAARLVLQLGEGQAWALAAAFANLAVTAALWLYHLRSFRQEAQAAGATRKRKS